MTPESTLTVRSSAELIAAVPFLLGFHPADSLVVVAVRDRRVLFAGRYDLPPLDSAEDLALHLAALIAREGVSGATLIGYGEATRVTPAVLQAAAALEHTGTDVLDAIRVTDGQFWSYLCAEPGCCPSPCPPSHSAVAAAATFAGQVALPDRAALVAQIAPVTGAERESMAAATARAQARLTDVYGDDPDAGGFARTLRRAGHQAVRDAERRHRAGRPLTDDEVAWLGVTLVDLKVRDYAWERTGAEDWRLSLWTDVLRRVEPGYVPAPAGLLSFAAWRQGLGALARVAVDRALAHDPDYSMAQQLEELLNCGVSPAMVLQWPEVDRVVFDPPAGTDGHRDGKVGDAERGRPPRSSIDRTAGRRGSRRGTHRKPRRRSV
jgi:hypothetical protein